MQPNLVKQLRDIHLPTPVSWWPLAPGWYMLTAIVLMFMVLLYLLWRKKRQRRLRKQAVMQQYQHLLAQHNLGAIMTLIKQVALIKYSQQIVAPLQGAALFEFMQQHNKKLQLSPQVIAQYTHLAYQASPEIDQQLKTFMQSWLEQQL